MENKKKKILVQGWGQEIYSRKQWLYYFNWVFDSWYLKKMQIKKMDFQKYFEITV